MLAESRCMARRSLCDNAGSPAFVLLTKLLPPTQLSDWIAYWKRLVAFEHGGSFWQKNFWDTQLRQGDSYAAKWEYVRSNPVRAGLADKPEDWAYQGELNVLRWHN